MADQTFLARLDHIRHDSHLMREERRRLDGVIRSLVARIKSTITPTTAPGLIWGLTLQEIDRVGQIIEHIADSRISDFASQARFLRALTAAVPFQTAIHGQDPQVEFLLKQCDALWHAIAHRQIMDFISDGQNEPSKRRRIAAWMSLLDAVQLETTYVEQADSRLRKIYEPFSAEIVAPVMGLDIDQISVGFETIRNAVIDRLRSSENFMRPMAAKWREFQELHASEQLDCNFDTFVRRDAEMERITADHHRGVELLDSIIVFSAQDVASVLGDRSTRFFEVFSFVPGEVNKDFATPFDFDSVRSRPFARLPDGQFLLMDFYYSAFAPLYRVPEVFTGRRQKQQLTRRRDQVLEEDALAMLSQVVQPELAIAQYYLPVGKNGALAERDVFLMRDGIALIVECKAKPLRSVSEHRGRVCKIESDVKSSIQEGYNQACSVHRVLCSEGQDIVLWDSDKSDKTAIARLNGGDTSEAFPVVVLDSYYGLVATDLEPWLQVDPIVGFPWVVSRDTLESIFSVISSFDELIAFLRWRKTVHGVATNEDEAVFVGFFLRHGPAEFPKDASLVQLDASYADVFEAEYFRKKGAPVDFPQEKGPPVWCSLQREDGKITYRVNGELHGSIELGSSEVSRPPSRGPKSAHQRASQHIDNQSFEPRIGRPRRNGPCPCGSGRKFKKCCWRRAR